MYRLAGLSGFLQAIETAHGPEATEKPWTFYTLYQLAPDHDTYGTDAVKFIVTSADHEREFSGPMSERDATTF